MSYKVSTLKKGLVGSWKLNAKLGEELVTNGTFEDSSNWSFGTGWSLVSNAAYHSGSLSGGYMTQTGLNINPGSRYLVRLHVDRASTLQFNLGDGTSSSEVFDAVGFYNVYLVAGSGNTNFWVWEGSGHAVTIDDVSVKEILPNKYALDLNSTVNWDDRGGSFAYETFSDDDNGEMTFANTTGYGMAWTNSILTLGKTYKIEFTTGAGTYSDTQFHVTSDPGTLANAQTRFNIAANTTYTKVLTIETTNGSTPSKLALRTNNGVTNSGSITIMSVKEIQTADSTPQGNNGTVYGATQNAESMTFDGTNDYVNVEDNNDLRLGTSDFSISTWFNSSTNNDNEGLFVQYVDSNNLVIFRKSATKLRLVITTASTPRLDAITGANAFSTDSWEHAVYTVDRDGSQHIYVNGVDLNLETDTQNSDGVDLSLSTPTIIGAENSANYLTGNMKDFRIYNRALSAEEVELLYKGGDSNVVI